MFDSIKIEQDGPLAVLYEKFCFAQIGAGKFLQDQPVDIFNIWKNSMAQLLEKTVQIIGFAEGILLDRNYRHGWSRYIFNIIDVPGAVIKGIGSFTAPVVQFTILWVILKLLFLIWTKFSAIPEAQAFGLNYVAAIFAFGFTAFAFPSSFVADGLKQPHVQKMIQLIQEKFDIDVPELDALALTLKEYQERALARVSVFQWVLAGGWAVATFLFSQYTGALMKLAPTTLDATQGYGNAAMSLAIFSIFLFLLLIAVFGYKRSVDKTFRLGLIALRQLRLELSPRTLPVIVAVDKR